VYAKLAYIEIMKYAKRRQSSKLALNILHIMFLDCIFEFSNICPMGYRVSATSYQQEQQQKLIDGNNQNNKNRILIVDDEKQHNKSLKLDL
jgi:hypothetical protein